MKRTVGFLVVGTLGALLVGGCASNESVKKDEAIAPAASTQNAQTKDKSTQNASAAVTTTSPATDNKNVANQATSQKMDQMKSALEKIYFDFDSSTLSEQARKSLTKNAEYLRNNSDANIRIEGNCDERGSAEYNLALGEKRAEAAMKYLTTLGIPEKRLTTISYGKEKPADPGHDEAAWTKNRRDDFTLQPK